MQLPSASRDLLMLAPSRSRAVWFFVTDALSDPARSISDSLDTLQLSDSELEGLDIRTNT